jgi:3-hydroxybutyryl-CoA dehydratase
MHWSIWKYCKRAFCEMDMDSEYAMLTLTDLVEGTQITFEKTVTASDIDAFAACTGDVSPLHMDREFARERGFDDRVVHGMLLAGYVSMGIGTKLPGANALLHGLDLKFLAPTYPGDRIRVTLEVTQVSHAVRVAVLKIHIHNIETGAELARGKAQVGSTQGLV